MLIQAKLKLLPEDISKNKDIYYLDSLLLKIIFELYAC